MRGIGRLFRARASAELLLCSHSTLTGGEAQQPFPFEEAVIGGTDQRMVGLRMLSRTLLIPPVAGPWLKSGTSLWFGSVVRSLLRIQGR